MSLQAQPQQPVQQQVYPTAATNQPPPPSHHSNGSFGAVFIVLAIILVISTVACFLGRLCNRRYNNNNNNNYRNHDHDHDHDHHRDHYHHNQRQRPVKQQQIHNIHPREGDIEFGGVDNKRIPPTIPRPKGLLVHAPARTGSHPPPPTNGRNMKDFEEIIKPDHEGELRAAV